jgi:hypothetical protein
MDAAYRSMASGCREPVRFDADLIQATSPAADSAWSKREHARAVGPAAHPARR